MTGGTENAKTDQDVQCGEGTYMSLMYVRFSKDHEG